MDHPGIQNGVLGFRGDGALTVNFDDALWKTAGGGVSPNPIAHDTLLGDILSETGHSSDIQNSMLQLSGSQGIGAIDKVIFADSNNGTTYAMIDDPNASMGKAAFFVGGDGSDTVTGSGGNDLIYGGAGNDTIMASNGNDIVDGGTGIDTVNYSPLSGGIVVTEEASGGTSGADYLDVAKNGDDPDHLYSIEHVIGTGGNDHFSLLAPSGLTIDGGSGGTDSVTYANPLIEDENGPSGATLVYDIAESAHDTLSNIAQVNGTVEIVLPNYSANETLTEGHTYDYSASPTGAVFNITSSLQINDDPAVGLTSINYGVGANVFLGTGAVHAGVVDSVTVIGFGLADALGQLTAQANAAMDGTNGNDTVTITANGDLPDAFVRFNMGTGDTVLTLDAVDATIGYRGGNAEINVTEQSGGTDTLSLWGDIRFADLSATMTANGFTLNVAGHGSVEVNETGNATLAIALEDGESISMDSSGHLTLVGTEQTFVTLSGTWENDAWTGRDGINYTFDGEGGNDTLTGGNGNDTLNGGAGNDLLIAAHWDGGFTGNPGRRRRHDHRAGLLRRGLQHRHDPVRGRLSRCRPPWRRRGRAGHHGQRHDHGGHRRHHHRRPRRGRYPDRRAGQRYPQRRRRQRHAGRQWRQRHLRKR